MRGSLRELDLSLSSPEGWHSGMSSDQPAQVPLVGVRPDCRWVALVGPELHPAGGLGNVLVGAAAQAVGSTVAGWREKGMC